MLPKLISHSPDLKRLYDDGLSLEIRDSHLLITDIPYLNTDGAIKHGTLISTLKVVGDATGTPDSHVAYFIGETPCHTDGKKILEIINSEADVNLVKGVTANFTFSSKPPGGYKDYYQKMTTYIQILSAPAKSVDNTVTEAPFKVYIPEVNESVFEYSNTNATRVRIVDLEEGLSGSKVGIIGLGGTGSYILDLVAKTPVGEIHTFDGDWYLQHNAFRSPGAISKEELLTERIKKVDYFQQIYQKMHRHIITHDEFVDESNIEILGDLDFVFISIDNGKPKKLIIEFLESKGISFIDVGMGIHKVDKKLIGILSVTASTPAKRDHVKSRINFEDDDEVKNEYITNIQIAELNALNAALAVIKWKKLMGFFQDLENEHYSAYAINVNQLVSEDRP